MKYLRKILVIAGLLISSIAIADEGMWLPLLLEKLNEKQMKSLGMKISAKDIYNVNKGSLKDAIISFGGFCTGEIVSSKGLVLTNHHCGFDAIQNHSTLDNNYIRDGFWSKSYNEELPNEGLFVTFIVRIEDVSATALKGVTNSMSEPERQSTIDKNLAEIRKNVKKESYQDSFVRGFFEGNQYYLFVTETYRDIRLVGAPPSSIGNFGHDTDNWVWPRHTGDFSMFRIYAGKDNKPADYSPDNIPYTPKRSLSISLDGLVENDFTMVFGFPGRTTEYLPSAAVEQIMKVNDPAKISIRDKALMVMDGFMRKDESIKIKYAAKYANVENAYKKWQGEVLGLESTNALEKKKAYETEFQKRVNANPQWKTMYGTLLSELEAAYSEIKPLGYARDYYNEIIPRIEVAVIEQQLLSLGLSKKNDGEAAFKIELPKVKQRLKDLYKEYSPEVDKKLFQVLIELYVKDSDPALISSKLKEKVLSAGGYGKLADELFETSILDNEQKVMDALNQENLSDLPELFWKDPLMTLFLDIINTYSNNVGVPLSKIQNKINKLQRTYMKAQMEVFKEKMFFPDANSTLRVAYGKVKGYRSRDAVQFDNYTYLDGVMEKYKPGDYEFDVPERLRMLYKTKDFGQYGMNGKMPVCFIATNHTTGGNSGSPVIDANGNLVGLNFDRAWEGTMSDINYDPSICRNIMVDIRYVLFLIDKYAGATRFIEEMKLVHPKKKP